MGTSTNTPATPGPTGIDAIDRIIRGVVMAFAASLPERMRGAYLLGSYADGGAVAMSDIDLLLLFSGALTEEERARAQSTAEACALLSPVRLDLIICDEASISGEVVPLRYGGRLVAGEDTRAALPLPPLPIYTRETLGAARFFMTVILRGQDHLTYPLAYPEPDGEFFGYDTVRVPEWYPPGTERGVKELVTTATRMARALLALEAGRYCGSKGGSVAAYREAIGGEWGDLLADLYANGKLRWGYSIPTPPDERRLLRDLCARMLAFEHHFLARYHTYLLELLRAGDAAEQAHARATLTLIHFPGAEPPAAP